MFRIPYRPRITPSQESVAFLSLLFASPETDVSFDSFHSICEMWVLAWSRLHVDPGKGCSGVKWVKNVGRLCLLSLPYTLALQGSMFNFHLIAPPLYDGCADYSLEQNASRRFSPLPVEIT